MDKGIIDGVSTSSAVIAHEMGGVLDKVKRIDGDKLNKFVEKEFLPRGNVFELTEMSDEKWDQISSEMIIDEDLVAECKKVIGKIIISVYRI